MQTAQSTKKTDALIEIEMWTDLICPWCGIGERHLAKALSSFPHRDYVRLSLRAYRLMPGETPQPAEEVIRNKYELRHQEVIESMTKLERLAETVGLEYHLAGSWAGDTMDGHRLVKLAAESGKEMLMYHRLFDAAMNERLPIHDHTVLKKLALEIDLDSEAIDKVLNGERYRDAVEAEERAMKGYGGRGVPFFVINRRYDYSGALASEIFLNALHKAWQEGDSDTSSSVEAGVLCGPDGCVLP